MQQHFFSTDVDIFSAIRSGAVADLWRCPRDHLRPFLPYLTRISCSPSSGDGATWSRHRLLLLSLLADVEEVNGVKQYLELDFAELRHDAVKEQQLLRKLRPGETRPAESSVLASSVSNGLMVEFEHSGSMRRTRLVLSELLRILHQASSSKGFQSLQLDLFECEVLMDEVGDVMCIVAAELPYLLPVAALAEALLRLKRGSYFICRLLGNMPSCFDKVITSLVTNGETQDELTLAGRRRAKAVIDLLSLCPANAPHIQWLTYTNHTLPTVMIFIALAAEQQREQDKQIVRVGDGAKFGGVVSLINNVIIYGDDATRAWFAQYIKAMQHKSRRQRSSAMTALRKYLMKKLVHYMTKGKGQSSMDVGEAILETVSDKGDLEEQFQSEVVPKAEENMEEEAEEEEEETVTVESASVGVMEEEEEMVMVDATSGEVVQEKEEEMDTESLAAATLELVGQMDIEISDQDAIGAELVGVVENKDATLSVEQAETVGVSTGVVTTTTTTTAPATTTSVVANGSDGYRADAGEKKELPHRGHRRRHSSILFENIDFPPLSLVQPFSDATITELMHLLRICCGLKIHAYMFLTGDETAALVHLITCTRPPFSAAGVKFVEVALCVLLACPFLISSEECEKAVVHWLQWLLDNLSLFESACPSHRCYGEMLLLVAMHLQEKQLKQIEDLVTATLEMKISNLPRSSHFSILREQFLKVFTENVVCSHAVSVSPTPRLSGEMTGYLPVHCILQLIRSKVFRKHGVSVKEWIYSQLLTTSEPLHPCLSPLIQEYVLAILLSSQSTRSTKPLPNSSTPTPSQSPFTAEEVLNIFRPRTVEGTEQMYPKSSQLLMLYYILYYQDTFLTNFKSLCTSPSPPSAYSPAVLAQLPVKRLLLHAWKHQEAYSTLYPSLLRLTTFQFPHLCLVEDWLKEEEMKNGSLYASVFRISADKVTVQYADKVLRELGQHPSRALLLLTHLSSLPALSLLPYSPVLTATLPLLLDHAVSKRIQQLYLTLWTELNSVAPRQLWVETVNALRPAHLITLPPYTHQQLTEDPLNVLRCDTKVFRCPSVFEMVLRVLAAYTSASRAWLTEQAHIQNCMAAISREGLSGRHVTPQEREELKVALTAAQESAAIQLLLETCLPSEEDRMNAASVGPQLTSLREIQCLVCSYLHQVFIADPNMAKLVHFQTYPLHLLPMTTAGIPSMHICLDFLAELLTQPQLDKQQFTIHLAAHVTQQYPLPEAVGVVKDIFKRLHVLANEIPEDKRETFFKPLLPALTKFCQTFPPLCTDATELLLHLGKLCLVSESNLLSQPGKNSQTVKENLACQVLESSYTAGEMGDVDFLVVDQARSCDPTMALEDQLDVMDGVSLIEGLQMVFKDIVNTSLLRVATKT